MRQVVGSFAFVILLPALAGPDRPSEKAGTAKTAAAPEKAAEIEQLLWQKLTAAIMKIDRDVDGVLGVAILDLTSGREWLLHGDEIFPQASSIKIAVLAELYRQAQDPSPGKAKLGDLYTVRETDLVPDSDVLLGMTPGVTRLTNRDLATLMVCVSDNSATNILIDRLGMDNVNSLLEGLGLKHTRLRRKMMDLQAAREGRENIATPREMMRLLAALHHGKLLNPALTADFFKVLSTNKDSALLRGLPEGTKAATKPGALEGVRNDSGIIFAKNRPFVLCVMMTYLRNERAGERAVSDISALAYRHFDRVGRASPYGRVISVGNSGTDAR
jgi:beta-lactamase class A